MGFTTQTPNMGLTLPNVSQEPGPQWATDINQSLTQVDQHNHAAGNGVPINSNGLNLTQDLSLNNANLINTRTVRFTPGAATSGTDLNCIYMNGNGVFFNDSNGNVEQITGAEIADSTSGIFNTLNTTAIIFGRINQNTSPIFASSGGNVVLNQRNGDANLDIGNGVTNNRAQISFVPGPGFPSKLLLPVGTGLSFIGSQNNTSIFISDLGTISGTSAVFQSIATTGITTPNTAQSLNFVTGGQITAQLTNTGGFSATSISGTSAVFQSVATTGITTPNTAQSLNFVGGGQITAQLTNVGGFSASCGVYGTGQANFPFQESASNGFVGQYLSNASSGPAISVPNTTVYGDATYLILPAGDWDVTGRLDFGNNGSVMVGVIGAISGVGGNSNAGIIQGVNGFEATPPTAAVNQGVIIPNIRWSIAATTTVFLKVRADYSAGTPNYFYSLSARRMR